MSSVWVFGAGGHAKVVIDTLRAAGEIVAGVLDDSASPGTWIQGVEVRGPIDPSTIASLGAQRAVVAIGANEARRDVVRLVGDRLEWINAIHPGAWIAESATLGRGTVVFAGCIVQPDSKIGEHVILNTGCSVDHDCVLEDFVHVAPGARLAGNVLVGEGAFLGMQSSVRQGQSIGPWAVIGSGAAVVTDIPAGATALGVPARFHELGVTTD